MEVSLSVAMLVDWWVRLKVWRLENRINTLRHTRRSLIMSAISSETQSVVPQLFKEAMSRISYSVSVVSTEVKGELYAKTINTLIPVAADEPSVLVSLYFSGTLASKVIESGKFCVSVLSNEQRQIAEDFAKPGLEKDPFESYKWRRLSTGAPAIEGGVAYLDCEVVESIQYSTHLLIVGRIVQIDTGETELPLLHHRRAYRPCSTSVIS